ncbi:putative lipoprotein [Mycobacteroides abscessus subsp. abscessus]|nr:putative lipoprotein [Mycobacteroides abscessus subsp. abscessus]
MFKIASIAIAGTAAAIALAACSPPNEQASTVSATTSSMPMSGHDMSGHSMPGMSGSSTSAAPAANFNDADVMFLQMMYPHHAQAVEMAKLVPTRSQNQQVKDLAAAIEKAQAPEMQQMTTLLAGFGKPAPSATMSHSMPGLMTPQQMTELTGLSGAAFDKMWLQMMVEHHQGAITMANDELKNGTNADAKAMAQAIITTQQAEITTMNGMLAKM